MNFLNADYMGFLLGVKSQQALDIGKTHEVLLHYLPGIRFIDDPVNEQYLSLEIIISGCHSIDEERCSWSRENKLEVRLNTVTPYPYLILGIFHSAVDLFLQEKGFFFLHSSGVLVGKSGILFWGKRADGKSTLAKLFSERGFKSIHDDRVGIADDDVMLNFRRYEIPLLEKKNLALMLTPKIIPAGTLRYWPLIQHSFLYELFCELSDSVRSNGVIEGNISLQSLDNPSVSAKRLSFCQDVAERLKECAFFIEGTANDIFEWVVRRLT